MARNESRKTKKKSRIPGVSVGNEVSTSVGKKKKVCFNIGGKWFFRMVDPVWRAPGRPLKAKKQKSPQLNTQRVHGLTGQGGQRSRGRRSATRGQKKKDRDKKSENTPVKYPKGTRFNKAGRSEDRDQKTVNSKQKTGERE